MITSDARARILMVSLIEENRAIAAITGRLIKHKIHSGGDSEIDDEILRAADLAARTQIQLTIVIEELQRRLR